MSKSFYVTLPSHSSKNEFPKNTANHFKIRLPNPIRLEGSGWKVALSSNSLPDPKNVLPHWLTETEALFYNTWYHGLPSGAKRFFKCYVQSNRLAWHPGSEQHDRCEFHEDCHGMVQQATL